VSNLLDKLRGATANVPSLIRSVVPSTPRRRAAVTVHDGYAAADMWVKARPTIFWSSVAGAVLSAGALYVRRKKGPETIAVYAASFAVSAGLAWVSRPGQGGTVAPGASTSDQVMSWLDARAARLDKSEPGWEEAATRRLIG
jgi:hypothetical protein